MNLGRPAAKKEFDSRDIAKRVEEHFDYEVPIYNGQVLLHPIILVVLDVLKEEGFLELEHRTTSQGHRRKGQRIGCIESKEAPDGP